MNRAPITSCFSKWRLLFIYLFLAVSTLSVYMQVVNFDFADFDDNIYVFENRNIQKGLTLKTIVWSFSFTEKTPYWHPLTWLSHSLDSQLYGLNAGMHHLSSLIIHILNSMLLFLVFKRMTGELWKSAFVAVLFALHPINVDSVAWVAERKNVLSTFFWFLTMLTYVRYCERPGLARYLLTCLVFVLGLLAKPMLVTLPCVLLLMDYWPLRRIQDLSISSISLKIMEKVPLFFLAGVSIYLSIASLESGQMASMEHRPMDLRIAHALVSYVSYMGKMIWPQSLAVHYPYPFSVPSWKLLGAGAFLVLISRLVLFDLKQKPYLSVGWLWFIGTLVPVIGLIQSGLWPAIANRWAYVPIIGLFIMITWGVPDLLAKWRYKTKFLTALALVGIFILIPVTWMQVQHWKNSISLFEHAVNVTDNNYFAHNSLGFALAQKGRIDEAINHYNEALKLNPVDPYTHNNLGMSLLKKSRTNEAIKHFNEALRVNPQFLAARYNLGRALSLQRRIDEKQ